jgi:ketosteroid isomerase-like protein
MDPREVIQHWIKAINAHDVADLAALMTRDFLFIDSLGRHVNGGQAMESGWRAYFELCPDYWIRGDDVLCEGGTALIAGEAGGTIDGESWRTPAAWKAEIRSGQIAEWRVFADNKPVYEILAKRRS